MLLTSLHDFTPPPPSERRCYHFPGLYRSLETSRTRDALEARTVISINLDVTPWLDRFRRGMFRTEIKIGWLCIKAAQMTRAARERPLVE